jgi:hypothetical protein
LTELPDPFEKELPSDRELLNWDAEAVLGRPSSAHVRSTALFCYTVTPSTAYWALTLYAGAARCAVVYTLLGADNTQERVAAVGAGGCGTGAQGR